MDKKKTVDDLLNEGRDGAKKILDKIKNLNLEILEEKLNDLEVEALEGIKRPIVCLI